MPITPRFSITQTDTHVRLDIKVPHVRVTTESIQVALSSPSEQTTRAPRVLDADDRDDNQLREETLTTLHFSSSPYLLVLNFEPNRFHESAAEACATYEPTIENGTVILSLKKATPASWDNLDLIGRMVRPKTPTAQISSSLKSIPTTTNWLQEVTDQTNVETGHTGENDDATNNEHESVRESGHYGFQRMFRGIFADLQQDGLAKEMLEFPWEEEATNGNIIFHDGAITENIFWRRRKQRWEQENIKFDKDRWLQDLDIEEDYVYQCALSMKPHWQCSSQAATETTTAPPRGKQSNEVDSITEGMESLSMRESFFSEDERLQLHSIPYPLLPETSDETENPPEALLLGLWDVLFGYVYDHLTSSGDPTVESAWTVTTLSSLLSNLEDYSDSVTLGNSEKDTLSSSQCATSLAVTSCVRRSLVYPYLRNISFAAYCAKQVVTVLNSGPRCIIRCLLQARKILEQSELYYLGNKLFLDPYLAWLQKDTNHIQKAIRLWTPKLESEVATIENRTLDDLDLSDDDSENGSDDSDDESESDSEDSSSEDDDDDASSGSARPDGDEKRGTGPSRVSSALLDSNIGNPTSPGLLQNMLSADSVAQEGPTE